jgi:hypothetical protein
MSDDPPGLEWASHRRAADRHPRTTLVAIGAAFAVGVLAAKALEWFALTRAAAR